MLFLPGYEYVNVTGIQVPDNLEDILRPKVQNYCCEPVFEADDFKVQEKPISFGQINRLGLQAHELPASRIKQRDDNPKHIVDYFDN